MELEKLADAPLGAVAYHRVSYFLTGRYSKSGRSELVRQGKAGHESSPKTGSSLVDLEEFCPSPELHRDDETLRRLRPFARRRLSTVRPFFVAIRTRKPW